MERFAFAARGFNDRTASSTFGLNQEETRNPLIDGSAARLSVGAGARGSYLPVSTPCASGDQTICEIPDFEQSASSAFSGSRCSREYCGWLETNFSTPAILSEASTRSTGHSEKPTYLVFPERTACVRASIVSSSGVLASYRWHWYRSI